MSEYVACVTEYEDQESLVEALVDVGIDREQIEVHAQGGRIEGYGGRVQTGNVIIRKSVLGAYADVGFEKLKDGKLRLWMDDMDKHRGKGALIAGNKLKQAYSKATMLKALKKLKHKAKVNKCEVDDQNRIRIEVSMR